MNDQSDAQHTVVVYFRMEGEDVAPVMALGEQLSETLARTATGAYEGHEVALLEGDDAYLFMTGADADQIFAVIRPVLQRSSLVRGGEVTLRYGAPDDELAVERRMAIGPV